MAGSLHATRATVRPASTTLTAGAGNPVLSFAEDVSSAVLSVVAVLAPLVGLLLLIVVAVVAVLWWRRIARARLGGPDYADPLHAVLPLLLTALALAGPAVAERPSVVVVMTDDQTYADMAAMPHPRADRQGGRASRAPTSPIRSAARRARRT